MIEESFADRQFQSTRPVGDATARWSAAEPDLKFQSTRPVGDATVLSTDPELRPLVFQSTRPVGDATALNAMQGAHYLVSIHASRGGRDSLAS